jgi:hypothetical protein
MCLRRAPEKYIAGAKASADRAALDNRLTDRRKVVSPTHRQHFTPKKHYASGTNFSYRLGKHLGLVRPEGFDKLKKLFTSSSLERAIFLLVVLTTTLPYQRFSLSCQLLVATLFGSIYQRCLLLNL